MGKFRDLNYNFFEANGEKTSNMIFRHSVATVTTSFSDEQINDVKVWSPSGSCIGHFKMNNEDYDEFYDWLIMNEAQ